MISEPIPMVLRRILPPVGGRDLHSLDRIAPLSGVFSLSPFMIAEVITLDCRHHGEWRPGSESKDLSGVRDASSSAASRVALWMLFISLTRAFT